MLHLAKSSFAAPLAILVVLIASCDAGAQNPDPTVRPAGTEPVSAPAGDSKEADKGRIQVEAGVPAYVLGTRVSGSLSSVGSDTMNNLMAFWSEAFKKRHPGVKVTVEGKGSSTGPIALTEATALLAPMSRAMKAAEIEKFEARHGYKPTAVRVAVDGLAVFVHKDNPLKELSLQQIDAIFSSTRSGGHAEDIAQWGQLGLSAWEGRPISLFGRNSASGTYGFMKERGLFNGDFKATVKEQPGSASVVQGIGEDLYSMGYSGIGYSTSNVKTLSIQGKDGTFYSPDDSANVLNGKYPLSRYLYVYVNRTPGRPLDPMVAEFFRFILSREGQEVVIKDHYLPLPARVVAEMRKQLEL